MTCISRQNVGKYTYLYESVSFRDQNGRPRNKKVSIGKIDPDTGRPVFKKEYLERMASAGTQKCPSLAANASRRSPFFMLISIITMPKPLILPQLRPCFFMR